MSQQYHVWIDDNDKGPYPPDWLRTLKLTGKIDDSTPVRKAEDTEWHSLGDFDLKTNMLPAATALPDDSKNLVIQRERLKREVATLKSISAYSGARGFFVFLVWLSSMLSVLGWFASMITWAGNDDYKMGWLFFAITATAAVFSSVILMMITTAIFDLADFTAMRNIKEKPEKAPE